MRPNFRPAGNTSFTWIDHVENSQLPLRHFHLAEQHVPGIVGAGGLGPATQDGDQPFGNLHPDLVLGVDQGPRLLIQLQPGTHIVPNGSKEMFDFCWFYMRKAHFSV